MKAQRIQNVIRVILEAGEKKNVRKKQNRYRAAKRNTES